MVATCSHFNSAIIIAHTVLTYFVLTLICELTIMHDEYDTRSARITKFKCNCIIY